MTYSQDISNNSIIIDHSIPINELYSFYEMKEGNESSIYPYFATDSFNHQYLIEMSGTEGPTNNLTNEEGYNAQIPQRGNRITFNIINTQRLLGRKRKDDKTIREHNKFSDDNKRRKVKHFVIKSIQNYTNKKLKNLLNGNIGYNSLKKEFLILNKQQKSNATIEANKAFLNKSIGNILSENISSKYTNYDEDHNKKLVESLKNDVNLNKKFNFIKFFDLTFLQCLEHYRGTKYFEELNGIRCFDEDKKNIKDDEEYIKELEKYLNNYENILNKKKPRKQAKKIPKRKNKN